MFFGSHRLEGELITLKEPHVITRKVRKFNRDKELEEVVYEVQGVARNKILFATRPVPMIDAKRSSVR